uniref:Hypothetical conserved protein n=2 Tax=Candidatus Bipolaricaulota TaxID=67810 RepID=H5SNJ0_9BACT|nr:hypothetical conserved protein [uncultured Acetothermia bacterium]BAL59054.1 hypothetical conserved protein [Candidatus Acetothermum autotrophicum]
MRGEQAERVARDFLRQHGYEIIAERYRWRGGEIDLVARDGNFLVFIEVRSRTQERFGLPEEQDGECYGRHEGPFTLQADLNKDGVASSLLWACLRYLVHN